MAMAKTSSCEFPMSSALDDAGPKIFTGSCKHWLSFGANFYASLFLDPQANEKAQPSRFKDHSRLAADPVLTVSCYLQSLFEDIHINIKSEMRISQPGGNVID